jgi:hypothetical protein
MIVSLFINANLQMNNQVKLLNLNTEFRQQFRLYTRRIGELSLGGLAAGFLLLAYSHTTLPSASVTETLLEKLGSEIAIPDVRFLLAAICSCCVALILTGWPPTGPFRRWVARPFLGLCFDLAGTALGAFVPTIIAAATPSEWGKATAVTVVALTYLMLMTMMLWLGRYLLSERFQKNLQKYPLPYPYVVPAGAAFILFFMFVGKN